MGIFFDGFFAFMPCPRVTESQIIRHEEVRNGPHRVTNCILHFSSQEFDLRENHEVTYVIIKNLNRGEWLAG